MVQSLTQYISEQLKRGYDINSIRQHLIKYGYAPQDVEHAIRQVNGHEIKHVIHFSKSTVIAIAILFAGVIGIFFAIKLIISPDQPVPPSAQTLLDLEVNEVSANPKPGEDYSFSVELTNMGAAKRYDVGIDMKISDRAGTVINEKYETVAVETKYSNTHKIRIPSETTPDSYYLNVVAEYEGKQANARIRFRVYEETTIAPAEPTCGDGIQNGDETGVDCGGICPDECETTVCGNCDDNDACTTDSCKDGQCIHTLKVPCCGNYKCEEGESESSCAKDCYVAKTGKYDDMPLEDLLNTVGETAMSSGSEAASICKELSITMYKEHCFEKIALTLNQSSYCGSIEDETRRDSCLVNYALQTKDFSICESINHEYLRENCITLREMSS